MKKYIQTHINLNKDSLMLVDKKKKEKKKNKNTTNNQSLIKIMI